MPQLSDLKSLAREAFLRAAGPALVVEVAGILARRRIPVMPLKGVLLQKLVYDPARFRPIVDVDLLVPEARFDEAYEALRWAGFSSERWEPGEWQVSLKRPGGAPLGIDLHRRLTRTVRSRLTGDGLFQRGTSNATLFGVAVTVPCPEDLLAHLLLHGTLHWIRYGRLHRPEDFPAVTQELGIDPDQCARHLKNQGLAPHALVLLPMVLDTADAFLSVDASLPSDRRDRRAARTIQAICDRFEPNHPMRRLAGIALAPSLWRAAMSAARDRLSHNRRRQSTTSPASSR